MTSRTHKAQTPSMIVLPFSRLAFDGLMLIRFSMKTRPKDNREQYTDTSLRDLQNIELVISILKGLRAVHPSVRTCRFAGRERKEKKRN